MHLCWFLSVLEYLLVLHSLPELKAAESNFSGVTVEAALTDVLNMSTSAGTKEALYLATADDASGPSMLVQAYNILQAKPLPVCPEGYVLANRHCHKRVK